MALAPGFHMLLMGAAALAAAMRLLVSTIGVFVGSGGVLVRAGSVPPGRLRIAFVVMVCCLTMVMRCGLMMRGRIMVSQSAHAADLCHMLPISAHGLAALATGLRMPAGVAMPAASFRLFCLFRAH